MVVSGFSFSWFGTLLLTVVGVGVAAVGLVGGLIVTFLWSDYRRRTQRVAQRLRTFKENVVGYSDTLDRLRDRHRRLPFAGDSSATVPEGETRVAYEAVQAAVQTHRTHWLQFMDLWEQTDRLVEKARFADQSGLRQAERLLGQADVVGATNRVHQECVPLLERLEGGVKSAGDLLEQVSQNRTQITAQLTALQAAGLSTDPYQPECQAIGALADLAARLVRTDPVGAQLELEQAQQRLTGLQGWLQRVEQRRAAAERARAELQAAETLIAQRREAGFSFAEPGSDPQLHLAEARQHLESLTQWLQRGEADLADAPLQRATACLGRAKQAVEDLAQFKALCGEQLAALRPQLQALRHDAETAQVQWDALERQFVPALWQDVQQNLPQANRLLDMLTALLDQAAHEAAEQQHYARALGLMEHVQRQLPEVTRAIAAVGERLRALESARDSYRSQSDQLRQESDRIAALLSTSTADRPACNRRFQAAVESLGTISAAASQPQPNWQQLTAQLEAVRADLQKVERLAREDFRLAE
jgi:septation ring formation regulator EzrA